MRASLLFRKYNLNEGSDKPAEEGKSATDICRPSQISPSSYAETSFNIMDLDLNP